MPMFLMYDGAASVLFNASASTALGGTISSVAIGPAAADRKVVILLDYVAPSATPASAMTIGGITATRVVQAFVTDAVTLVSEIWIAAVPTGTTANVVVTGGGGNARYGSYSLYGVLSATPTATATDTAAPWSQSLAIPAGGVAIGGFITSPAAASTWVNLTEDFDATTVSLAQGSGASFASGTAITPTISVSGSGNPGAMALAAWV